MIESLRIRNLRGIRECSINGLTDVNVLVGRNGAGKSTVLEAIYLASSWAESHDQLGRDKVYYVVTRRALRGNWDALWFAKNVEEDIEITIDFKPSGRLRFKVLYSIPIKQQPVSPVLLELTQEVIEPWTLRKYGLAELPVYYSLEANTLWDPKVKVYSALTPEDKGYLLSKLGNAVEFLRGVVFIDGRLSVTDVELKVWPKLLDKRLDKRIVELLREEYEPNMEGITFKPTGEGGFVLALTLPNTTIEVDTLGDGARTALILASLMALAKNTAALMEDPEIHQHPGGLVTLMRFALKLAKDRSLQLFISTHSVELVNIVRRLCEELGLGFRVFFMERDYSSGVVDVRVLESLDVDVLQKIGLDPNDPLPASPEA
jgi:energy-coupling factor transporter ATP-binding protein EcfA2